MSKQFWTGVALGALTVGAAALATSNNRCCGYYGTSYFGSYTGFNNFGFNTYGYNNFGFNNSAFGLGFCCIPKYIGETPFESFGFSNHTLAQMPLGYFLA